MKKIISAIKRGILLIYCFVFFETADLQSYCSYFWLSGSYVCNACKMSRPHLKTTIVFGCQKKASFCDKSNFAATWRLGILRGKGGQHAQLALFTNSVTVPKLTLLALEDSDFLRFDFSGIPFFFVLTSNKMIALKIHLTFF